MFPDFPETKCIITNQKHKIIKSPTVLIKDFFVTTHFITTLWGKGLECGEASSHVASYPVGHGSGAHNCIIRVPYLLYPEP